MQIEKSPALKAATCYFAPHQQIRVPGNTIN
jgi:hypothetical protein